MAEDYESDFKDAEKFQNCGDHEGAEKLYTRLIENLSVTETVESDSRNKLLSLSYNNRGLIKYLRVDFDEASEDYAKALNYDKKTPVTYYNRGLIHYRLGRFENAISDLKEVLVLDPTFESAKKCLNQSLKDKEERMKRGY